jgi:hypothetical protein
MSRLQIADHLEKMIPVLDLGGKISEKWFELTSYEDMEVAGYFTRTAIRHFWEGEELSEGCHLRRWFALLAKNEDGHPYMPVSLCVTPPGIEVKSKIVADCHTTGFMNKSPYPDFAGQIEALAVHIGIELPPNCMGRPVEIDVAPKPGF